MEPLSHKKLYRSRTDRIIAGVCGGLGKYFGVDPIIFRVIFFLLAIAHGTGILIYIVMMIFIPNEPIGAEPVHEYGHGTINNFAQEMRQGVEHFASQIKNQHGTNHRRNTIGMVVVLIGGLLLLQQLFPYNFFGWDLFWPVVIIVVGLYIMSRRS